MLEVPLSTRAVFAVEQPPIQLIRAGLPPIVRSMISRPNLRFWPKSNSNAVWTLADSAASSASNFVLGSLVAIRSTPELYGRFALAFALYGLTFGIWRAWATEPFLLGMRSRSNGLGSVIGACGVIGTVAMALGILIASGVDGTGRSLLLVVAVSLPVLAAHDGVRYCLIGTNRAHLALFVDGLWLALMFAGSIRIAEPVWLILWWSLSCGLTLLLGLQVLKWPSLFGGRTWLRQTRQVGTRFVFEFLVVTGSNSAIMFAVGFSSGLAEMGAYRGAAVLIGPVAVIMNGVVTVVLTMGTHSRDSTQTGTTEAVSNIRQVRSRVQKLAVLSWLTGVGWSGLVLIIPSVIGESILGETWDASRRAAVPLALAVGGQAMILVATAGYRLLGRINQGARIKATAMLLVMVISSSASFQGGAFAASAGFAVATIGLGTIIVALFRRDASTLAQTKLDGVPVDVGLSLDETDPAV